MLRIATPNRVPDLFGAGKDGFKDGDLANAIQATEFSAAWANGQQEELMSVIEGAGIAPGAGLTQVLQAIKRLTGGNITTVNAANSPFVLTADHAGRVIMDATAGNVVANLPLANALSVPLKYRFDRADATANSATTNCAGANTLVGGATSFTLTGLGDYRAIESDTASKWGTTSANEAGVSQRKIAQIVTFTTGAVFTGTTVIPLDDTIPQNTEGDQYLSLTITPKNAASELHIDVVLQISPSAGNHVITALFQDAGANALAAFVNIPGSGTYMNAAVFKHVMTAGGTAATTFKVRCGIDSSGTITINGQSGGRKMGGVISSRITIKEYLP